MNSRLGGLAIGLVGGLAAGAVQAGTIFSNPIDPANYANADCVFSTTCATVAGKGDDFAAQLFTIGASVTANTATFSELDLGVTPTSVNWQILDANGAGGLPGTLVASGTSLVSGSRQIGAWSGYDVTQNAFGLGATTLAPGSYYLAIQGVSTVFDTYLGQGLLDTGAAETHDGGATWSGNYGQLKQIGGIAVAIYTGGAAVPEPASWSLLLTGFALAGYALRRRAGILAA